MDNMSWNFCEIWNKSLEEGRTERILEPRQKLWASELGGSYTDRFLKMTAIPPSNPPNPRSLRKFEAGNIWEAIIGYVLSRAGILIQKQKYVTYQYPGLFPVTGKLDFIAGGNPDYDKSLAIISQEFIWLPEFISRATKNIIISLKTKYPNGLKNIILEIKSCSSFMYELYEKRNEGSLNHKLQDFHYLKGENMPEGHIVYISKDDARIIEIGIFNPSPLEDYYKTDIEYMTNCVKNNQQPPLEQPVVYDEMFKKFSANWKVGYSSYLTYLYKLKDQKEFDDTYKPLVEKWNRVLGRIKDKKEMTANNQAVLKEIKDYSFDVDKILEKA